MIGECENCQAEGVEISVYKRGLNNERSAELCNLCAGTMSGNVTLYPDNHREYGEVLQCICYVGNQIIKAIKESRATNDQNQ